MVRPILLLLLPLLAVNVSFGFRPSTRPTVKISWSKLQSAKISSQEEGNISTKCASVGRRELMAAGAATVVSAAFASQQQQQRQQSTSLIASVGSTATSQGQVIASIDDALAMIDAQCDRRFLHAVVASDYQCLYQGLPKAEAGQPRLFRFDVHQESTAVSTAPTSTDFVQALESMTSHPLQGGFASNSIFQLSATNPKMVQANHLSPMTVCPLGDNVHFAWTPAQDEDLFQSKQLIVDGIDCGVMSLEDALERPQGQVLVHASSVLLVPASMQQELIAKLKESFII